MIKKKGLGIDVLTAARKRVVDTFQYGKVVQLTFSGGKDSIVLADIVYNLLMEGAFPKEQLTVLFVDEEAMYDDVIESVKKWRTKFMTAGVKFEWLCIPVKHFNCLNTLTDEETFICWDPRKKDKWIREMPPFAITDDPWLIPYKDNYQSFLERRDAANHVVSMRGIRVAESTQRRVNIGNTKFLDKVSFPIYDFSDPDIWLYIRKFNLEYPEAYEKLYRTGCNRKQLRISQFFSIDTARSLVKLEEMYPGLMAKIKEREPNAYLCALYWDSEMFGRSTKKRRELEKEQEKKDYKALTFEKLREPDNIDAKLKHDTRICIGKFSQFFTEKDWKNTYEMLCCGDPKKRKLRGIMTSVLNNKKEKLNG